MSWDAAVTHETLRTQISQGFDTWKLRPRRNAFAYYGPAARTAFVEGGLWVLERLNEWGSLTETDAINELRKGDQSIYHVLFADDPRIIADCPNDGPTPISQRGFCDRCGWEIR